ncbi:MAG: toll/interleukin-1 receptor domain-containing protein, partial [Planctomycetota bacterium]
DELLQWPGFRREEVSVCRRHDQIVTVDGSCDLCEDEPQTETGLTRILISPPPEMANTRPTHVFLSHASEDKPFVDRLHADLESFGLNCFYDRESIQPGDSIAARINQGLEEADFFLVVLSPHSIDSAWVQMETDAAFMAEADGQSTVVLPVVIDECEIPPLLKPKLYVDLRDYDVGLAKLQDFLTTDSAPLTESNERSKGVSFSPCVSELSAMTGGQLRRGLTNLGRDELILLWFDTLETDMEDDHRHDTLGVCAMQLILSCKRTKHVEDLYKNICGNDNWQRSVLP